MITGKMYNVLKFLALVLLPALGTLYFALAGIWGLPSAEQVVGTIVAVDTFLGVILQISSNTYNSVTAQGTIAIHETDDAKTYSLHLDDDPELELDGKKQVLFKVKRTAKAPARPKKLPKPVTPSPMSKQR
jgi:hypothetical protein